MTFIAAGAAIVGSLIGADASSSAASAQSDAANRATDVQRQMFDKQVELNAPFRDNGLAAQNRLMTLLGLGGAPGGVGPNTADFGKYARDFGMADFQEDPGYAWRLKQGQQALERSASARGGMFSGRAAKDLTNYAQGAASQEYGNAFNRYQINRNNQLNPLQSLSGAGQTATGQMNNAAQNFGNAAGGNMIQAGNAKASGYMGQANAITGGINQYANYNQTQNMLNKMFPTSSGTNSFGWGGQPAGATFDINDFS